VEFNDGADPRPPRQLAKASEVAIVFVNQPTSEGRDVRTLTLPDKQDDLVSAVAAANPHTIVVLETGGAVGHALDRAGQRRARGLVPGIRGAQAAANILFGDVNPSAKLPVTFAKTDADLPHPQIPGLETDSRRPGGRPDAGFRYRLHRGPEGRLQVVRCRRQTAAVRVRPRPQLHHLRDTPASRPPSTACRSRCGTRASAPATEIVEVYAGLPSAASEPPKRLVAWDKVALAPGESKTVTLPLDAKFLSIFDEQKDDWNDAARRVQDLRRRVLEEIRR
jgi:beta-glucosidase